MVLGPLLSLITVCDACQAGQPVLEGQPALCCKTMLPLPGGMLVALSTWEQLYEGCTHDSCVCQVCSLLFTLLHYNIGPGPPGQAALPVTGSAVQIGIIVNAT